MQKLIGVLELLLTNKDSKFAELLRFGLVGVLATIIHYGAYIGLLGYVKINIAYTLAYGLSFVINFLLSNYFTFKTKPDIKKGIGFGFSHALNYLLHIVLLNLFMWFGVTKQYAPIPVFAIVIPTNYLLIRSFMKPKSI